MVLTGLVSAVATTLRRHVSPMLYRAQVLNACRQRVYILLLMQGLYNHIAGVRWHFDSHLAVRIAAVRVRLLPGMPRCWQRQQTVLFAELDFQSLSLMLLLVDQIAYFYALLVEPGTLRTQVVAAKLHSVIGRRLYPNLKVEFILDRGGWSLSDLSLSAGCWQDYLGIRCLFTLFILRLVGSHCG